MKKTLSYILPVLLLAACSVNEPVTEPVGRDVEKENPTSDIIPGQATVVFDDSMIDLIESDLEEGRVVTKSAGLNEVLEELGIVSMRRVFPDAGEYEERTRREGMHKFYTVVFDEDVPVTKALGDLSAVPGIESVEPVRKVRRRVSYDDPYFSSQWHLVNNSGADINVKKVWDNYTVGSPDVVVCVVDEAIDVTHEDLKDNLWSDASGHHGYNFVNNSYNLSISTGSSAYDYEDSDIGHGTHVAGTVAAVSNNGKGVAGVAGGDYASGKGGVRLMSCQIFYGFDGASDDATCNAIKWGADHGALISQNSWGYYADTNDDGKVSSSELSEFKTYKIDSKMKKAIDYFIKYAGCDNAGNQKADSPMKGGLVIFAAGNENIDYDPICDYEPVISVGAFGKSGKKASYSNYGDWVDIGAPGGDGSYDIWSTVPTLLYSSAYSGSGWQGTSMACPHASGVAALIISYFGGSGFTADMCKEYLIEGAVDGFFDSKKPIGRKLDAFGAFQYGFTHGGGSSEDPVPPVIKIQSEDLTVKAHESVSVAVVVTDDNGDEVTVDCNTGSAAATLFYDGLIYRLDIVGRDAPAGTYEAVFTATDATGLSTTASLRYTILENHAPQVVKTIDNIVLQALAVSVPVDISGVIVDPDGEKLSYTFDVSDRLAVNTSVSDNVMNVTSLTYGVTDITITATDALGLSASTSFSVLVRNPDKHNVSAWPNPVSDVLNVRIDSPSADVDIKLVTSSGAVVLHESIKGASAFNVIPVDVTAVAPGVYTLMVTYDGKTTKSRIIRK